MVLAALGDDRSEAQLARLMGTRYYGTPASRIMRLERWGYRVEYGPSSLETLQRHLAQGLLSIVFVAAEFLTWTDFEGLHALVLIEVTAAEVVVLDPSVDHGPSRSAIDGFLAAWEEFDFRAAVVFLA